MERYSFSRSESPELARFTRNKEGFLYVFRRFSDRWDVFKLALEKLREAHELGFSADHILDRMTPHYRVIDGSCSCPGFSYRRDCWHRDQVREWKP